MVRSRVYRAASSVAGTSAATSSSAMIGVYNYAKYYRLCTSIAKLFYFSALGYKMKMIIVKNNAG